ncbi:uncharacterized protein LOC131662426 [Vicia villosa]|uniref:uncharacterized protein LOC131662426 n=1 Tax=Vicia villosa TaxID=3911 RepID=UPI00273B9AE4|nr:uncharacterized protein LOC131662426 [Vicia villosa]
MSELHTMEMRQDWMLSPAGDSEPTLRTAHFLKPISNSIHEFSLNPSSSSSVLEPKGCPLKINFNGWRYPHTKWVRWVDQLKPKYESVWKKAGIFEPIMSTKSRIMKNQDLLYGVAEKWCSQTNTFVFPFAEATITLEDVMVLGGYSLFGDPVFTPLEDQEMGEVEKKLDDIERQERIIKSMAPTTSRWMDIFMNKGSEIEHEAFLVTWLSVFVFPHKYNLVKSCLFPIAVHLTRGNRIALAPAVLASLYNDLSLFKEIIVGFKKCLVRGVELPLVLEVDVQSPFYLVQVWVWERFKNLQPQSNLIDKEEHVLLRWNMVRALKIDNVRFAFDSAIDDFLWRPYVRYADKCGMYYPNDEISVPFKTDLDIQMLSFVLCLRVSELVGIECIEQYLPHRVAMQFGMDQDVPGYVSRFNETKEVAWNNYTRPSSDTSLYFPSRFFEADVTTRYAKWWKKSVLGPQGFNKNVVRRKRSARSLKFRPHHAALFPLPKLVDDDVPKVLKTMSSENSAEDGLKDEKNSDAPSSLPPEHNTLTPLLSAVEDCKTVSEDVKFKDGNSVKDGLESEKNVDANADAEATSSLSREHNTLILSPLISVEVCKNVLEDDEFKDANESKEAGLSSERMCEPETQGVSYSYLSDASIAKLEERIIRLEKLHRELKMARKSREGNARPMSGSH